MKIATINNLKDFLSLMIELFGKKKLAVKHRNALETYILNIDYTGLEFNTDIIVGNNAPYVGSAVVGQTYVA